MFLLIAFYLFLIFYKRINADIEQVLHDGDDTKRGGKRSIFYELRDSPTLPSLEKSSLRLEHEGTLLVMAGIERNLYPPKSLNLSDMYARNGINGKIYGYYSFPSDFESRNDG